MKRIFLAVTMLVFVLPAMRQAEAGTDVSIDFFYDNVGSDGSWVEMADYGYCWQPSVAVSNSNWRPYSDGYWAYTEVGWTWVSYEDFGWATYHYGRWTRVRDRGWFWVPGREWGPAWVSWRTGGDYVGWAPLPPRGSGEDYDDRPINGQADVEFDIGPASYNFVDVRYIGEPVLRERIFEANLNGTYISATVNVTNITYANSTVYNYGPAYDTLSRYSTRPIRRLTLEHEANVDLSVAVKPNSLTRVQGDKLIIAAPSRLQRSLKPIAPKMVKEKIAKPTFEHGWSDVSDPKAQAELKRKMKGEDPRNIPPPSIKPRENGETAMTPVVSANPAATAVPATSANQAMSPPEKHKNVRGERSDPVVSPSSSIAPGMLGSVPDAGLTSSSPIPVRKKPSDRQQGSPSSLATSPDGTPFREPLTDKVAPHRDAPPVSLPRRLPPPERVALPSREAPPDSLPKRPVPPERVVAPPAREVPPDVPHKHLMPPERVATPSGPAANGPVKTEAPPGRRGYDKTTTLPSPPPGS